MLKKSGEIWENTSKSWSKWWIWGKLEENLDIHYTSCFFRSFHRMNVPKQIFPVSLPICDTSHMGHSLVTGGSHINHKLELHFRLKFYKLLQIYPFVTPLQVYHTWNMKNESVALAGFSLNLSICDDLQMGNR